LVKCRGPQSTLSHHPRPRRCLQRASPSLTRNFPLPRTHPNNTFTPEPPPCHAVTAAPGVASGHGGHATTAPPRCSAASAARSQPQLTGRPSLPIVNHGHEPKEEEWCVCK
jgi:hypothetical protein